MGPAITLQYVVGRWGSRCVHERWVGGWAAGGWTIGYVDCASDHPPHVRVHTGEEEEDRGEEGGGEWSK